MLRTAEEDCSIYWDHDLRRRVCRIGSVSVWRGLSGNKGRKGKRRHPLREEEGWELPSIRSYYKRVVIRVIRYMDYGWRPSVVDWGVVSQYACWQHNCRFKSVTRAMGAATLRRGTIASVNQPPLPRLWKRRWYVLRLLSGAIPSTWLYLLPFYRVWGAQKFILIRWAWQDPGPKLM